MSDSVENILPYASGSQKGEEVEKMFDNIAPAYDFMNTAMSMGMHKMWRNRAIDDAVAMLASNGINPEGADILDVATGTGDVVFALHHRLPQAHIYGIDLSEGMLKIARKKLAGYSRQTGRLLGFGRGDCLCMPFTDEQFDMVTVAYGVRNFEHLDKGLKEMLRVLRPGGVVCIIELSVPEKPRLKHWYDIYTTRIIPRVGKMVSGDSRAYTYLPQSIAACPQRDDMVRLLHDAGFHNCKWRQLSFGAVCIYLASKR